jgi:hypothetical protein
MPMRLLRCVAPTAARTLRDNGTFDRRVREAVPVFTAWTVIALTLPIISRTMEGKRTAQRTLERLTTLTAPSYIPRSVFVGVHA